MSVTAVVTDTRICDIGYFKDLVFNFDREVCGNFKITESCLSNIKQLETTGKQSTCQHKVYTPVIWHTHSYLSKSYPSHQDILKIIKNKAISTSVIFTKWGIWILFFPYYLENVNNPYIYKLYCEEIDKVSYFLYKDTENGRVDIIDSELTRNAINKYIKDIQNMFNNKLDIVFDSWNDIYKDKIFVKIVN